MKPTDFKDISIFKKIKSTHLFVHEIAFQDQKSVGSFNLEKLLSTKLQHALDNHYCISLIECPFEFNFNSFLSHFEWCFKFMFFNFSETTLKFDVLNKLNEAHWPEGSIDTLLNIISNNPRSYEYSLNEYTGEIKFALLKHTNIQREEVFKEILARDENIREHIRSCLFNLNQTDNISEQQTLAERDFRPAVFSKGYEPSQYGFIKINDVLDVESQNTVINFLYETLHDLFKKEYTLEDFTCIFHPNDNWREIELDITRPNRHYLDAQKLHLLFRELKDNKVIIASWDTIKQKLIVHNKDNEVVGTAYQISMGKVSPAKLRQTQKLLLAVLRLMPPEGII